MRHLWTTVTTEHTVTHDAGEPEWLDLPLDDFVIPSTPDVEELPILYELDPAWLILSKWLIDEIDVGLPLLPTVEYRDAFGFTLYGEEIYVDGVEDFYVPSVFTSDPVVLVHRLEDLWYSVPGLYTFTVRWAGSRATREIGKFSLMIHGLNGGGQNE